MNDTPEPQLPDLPPEGRPEGESPAPESPARLRARGSRLRRVMRRALIVLLVVLLLLTLAPLVLYTLRREAAHQVLSDWFERRGIPAVIEVRSIELDGFVGSIVIGDPEDPDFASEEMVVRYSVNAPWSRGGLGLTPTDIRILRPTLRVRYSEGRLSFGALDPLIDEFSQREPRADVPAPRVSVEDGRLNLITRGGVLPARLDLLADQGRLMNLSARTEGGPLSGPDFEADVGASSLTLTTRGNRTDLALDASARSLRRGEAGGALSLDNARLRLTADLAYPDTLRRQLDGPARLSLSFAADSYNAGASAARDLTLDLDFDGMGAGWLDNWRLSGDSAMRLSASVLSAPSLDARGLSLSLGSAPAELASGREGLRWRFDGPARVRAAQLQTSGLNLSGLELSGSDVVAGGRGGALEITGPLRLNARSARSGPLTLTGVSGSVLSDVRVSEASLIDLRLALSSRGGALALLGAPAAGDNGDLVVLKRALGDFALSAPDLRVATGTSGTEVLLGAPLTLTPRTGGLIRISATPAQPLWRATPDFGSGGSFEMISTRAGGGLPDASVQVSNLRLPQGGFVADVSGRAGLDYDFARGIDLTFSGQLANTGGQTRFAARECVSVSTRALVFGDNTVSDLSGALCPVSAPLLTINGGNWRLVSEARGVSAHVDFLDIAISEAAGPLTFANTPAGLEAEADVRAAALSDTAEMLRFNPLASDGRITLARDRWRGDLALRADGQHLGQMSLNHDQASGAGGVDFDMTGLSFTQDGLQPSRLTPIGANLVTGNAEGRAHFTGRFGWTRDDSSSAGRAVIERLDFDSPAGRVEGLSGTLDFASLVPLTTAPAQHLVAERIGAVTTLENIEATFSLGPTGLVIDAATLRAAGGRVRIEPMTLPLTASIPFEGVLVLEDVDLGQIIVDAGFGNTVRVEARVSGRLPFVSDADGRVRIVDGQLAATGPGRLSIRRGGLTDVATDGGSAEAPDVVQDLAYQALEHMAFDILSADVRTLPAGRLGLVFRLRGRHDPPVYQEIRLTPSQLLNQDFLSGPLPLPSGTEVNLTLDVSLNLDELIEQLREEMARSEGQ